MRDALIDRYGDQLTKEQLDALAAGQIDAADALAAFTAGAGLVATVAAAASAV